MIKIIWQDPRNFDFTDATIVALSVGLTGTVENPLPTSFFDLDPHGLAGGGLYGLHAVSAISKSSDSVKIITTGFVDQDKINSNYAKIHKDYLINVLEVPASKVSELPPANSTSKEIQQILLLCPKQNLKQIVIIANLWHLPRINELILNHPDFDKQNVSFILMPCEWVDIKLTMGVTAFEFERLSVYFSQYIRRITFESRGVVHLRRGIYKPNF